MWVALILRGWKLEVMGAAVNVLSLFPCGWTCSRLEEGCDCSQDAVPRPPNTQTTRLPGAAHRAGGSCSWGFFACPQETVTRRTHEQEQPTGQGRRRAPWGPALLPSLPL